MLESRDNWQPLETIPKDGTYVLVFSEGWRKHHNHPLQAIIASYDAEVGWCADDGYALTDQPTSWAPLLASPAAPPIPATREQLCAS